MEKIVYNKHDWQNLELITEELMDNMEDGISQATDKINENSEAIATIRNALSSLEQPPTYTSPSGSLSASLNVIETGVSTNITLTPSFTKNDAGSIIEVKFYKGTTLIKTQSNLNAVTTTADGVTTTFKVEMKYADGLIKNTNLGNPYPSTSIKSGTISKTCSVTAIGKSYYGVGKSTLQTTVKNSKSFDYKNISCSNDVIIYKYPKSLGALTSIKDANNFDYINSYNRTEETINNIVYYVYTMKDPTTVSGFTQLFR